MKQYFSLIFSILLSLSVCANDFSIKKGNGLKCKSFDASTTNIDGDVFIFSRDMDEVAIEFSVDDSTGFKWYEYDREVNITKLAESDYSIADDGKSSTLNNIKGNNGYYVEYGEEGCEKADTCMKKYVWITIYEPIDSVAWDKEIICYDFTDFMLHVKPYMEYALVDNSGYNTITGFIERDLQIEYSTFKEEDRKAGIYEVSESGMYSTMIILRPAPYIDTDFTITDNFCMKLNPDSAVFVADTFYTSEVIAFPFISVKNKEENELDPDKNWEKDAFGNVVLYFSETPGGVLTEFRTSAPMLVDFTSNASPKVNKYEWHISRNEDFANDLVYYEKELNNYIFSELGTHYIKLVVRNNIELPYEYCFSETYASITISESEILVPNVFTPNGDGVNDKFKVAYKSIASYRCRVYNQFGIKVYDSTDITQGWDGSIGGARAPVGAYFYVIEAEGTDGKEIKKTGDINLIRSK